MSDFPRKASHFREWSKRMLEQATVPERLSHTATSKTRGSKGTKKRHKRRKRFLRRKRGKQE